MVNVRLLIKLFTTNISVNNFGPFSFEVWGSVSDWSMVLVTLVTAIYLIKTFRSQQVITKIEQANFRQKFLPVFEITGNQKLGQTPPSYNFSIKLIKNEITHLNISSMDENYNSVWDDWNNIPNLYREVGFTVQFSSTRSTTNPIKRIDSNELVILLKYTDVVGNRYEQYLTSNSGNLKLEYPNFVGRKI